MKTTYDDGDIDEEDTIFDIRSSANWLLVDEIPPWMEVGYYAIVAVSLGLIGFMLPMLLTSVSVRGILFTFGLPALIMYVARYAMVSEAPHHGIRLSRDGLVVYNLAKSIKGRHVYDTIPFDRIMHVRTGTTSWGAHEIYVGYKGGNYTEYEKDRELDVYGFIEALYNLAPEARIPSPDDFIASVDESMKKDSGTSQYRVGHDVERNVLFIGMMYITPFVLLLLLPQVVFDFYRLPMTIGFVLMVIFMSVGTLTMMIMALMEETERFLDTLEMRLRIEGDEAIIPKPVVARLILSTRSSISLSEITEAKKHLVLNPLTNKTLVRTVRGYAFIAPSRVFDDLEKHPSFMREGRTLVNIGSISDEEVPVARISWTRIRLFFNLPAIVSICIATWYLLTHL